jgi:hypothetical protein
MKRKPRRISHPRSRGRNPEFQNAKTANSLTLVSCSPRHSRVRYIPSHTPERHYFRNHFCRNNAWIRGHRKATSLHTHASLHRYRRTTRCLSPRPAEVSGTADESVAARLGRGRALLPCRDVSALASESEAHVRDLGPFAFSGRSSLRSIVVPSCVRKIRCFSRCEELTAAWPEGGSLENVGGSAFSSCAGLRCLVLVADSRLSGIPERL